MTPSIEEPMREGSRDGQGGCLVCGKDTPSTRAKYCTRAHQQRSYRLRHQTPTADLTHVRTAFSAAHSADRSHHLRVWRLRRTFPWRPPL